MEVVSVSLVKPISTKEDLAKESSLAMVDTPTVMENFMKVIGFLAVNMAKESTQPKTAMSTRASLRTVRNMVKVVLSTVASPKTNSRHSIKVNGMRTRETAVVSSNTLTVTSTTDSSSSTKRTALVVSNT